MQWKKRSSASTTADVITTNTGMSLKELLDDTREYEYPGLDEGADLFLKHAQKGSRIVVHGDYDTDGITFLSEIKLLCSSLRLPNVKIVAPRRFSDGYGVNTKQVDSYIADGFNLLLLGDNGIAAVEAIENARNAGMDVIILDHHPAKVDVSGNVVLPNANVIVDPHITGGDFEDLCGAGIGYHFALKVLDRCLWLSAKHKTFIQKRLAAFAAIGTIGDVVPLVYDNRKIVKEGISYLQHRNCTKGLSSLLETFNMEHITSIGIGFNLSAGINASGRLEDDGPANMVKLLTYSEECAELTTACIEAKAKNEKRKEMVSKAMIRAEDEMLSHGTDNFIVYYDENITSGIAGLISGKLTETYNRPSIVLCPDPKDPANIKGSGRSIPDINMRKLLDSVNTLFVQYGGHEQACGLTLKKSNLNNLRKILNEITPTHKPIDAYYYDLETNLANLDSVVDELNRFEPYGEGNPQPIFRIDNISLGNSTGDTYRTMGGDSQHIKFFIKDFSNIELVWFDGAFTYKYMGAPSNIDILATISLHVYNGKTATQLQVVDLRRHVM